MWTFEQKSFPKLDFVIKYNLIIGLVSFRIKPKSLQKNSQSRNPALGIFSAETATSCTFQESYEF